MLTCQDVAPLYPYQQPPAPALGLCPCFPTSPAPSSSSPWMPGAVVAAAHTAHTHTHTRTDIAPMTEAQGPFLGKGERVWKAFSEMGL